MRYLVLVTASLLLACTAQSTINVAAVLMKKDPLDRSKSVPVLVSDVAVNPNRDIISFGATECEDLVAVHESGAPLSENPTDAVTGFCSRACSPEKADACATGTALDRDPSTAMSCRMLLLGQPLPPISDDVVPVDPYFCARAPHVGP